MNNNLTGQKDVDLLILSDLDDKDLISFCLINKQANDFCSKYDKELWKTRFIKKYGQDSIKFKSPDRSWKHFYLSILKYWKSNKMLFFIDLALLDAAKDDDKDLINFFIYKGAEKWNWGLQGAAIGGHKDLIDFFISKGISARNVWNLGMEGAAEGGHRDLVDFFISKGASNWNMGLEGAARGGNKDLVDFFISKGASQWIMGLLGAAEGNHKDLVDFFISKGANTFNDLERAIAYASDEGHVELVHYLHSKKKYYKN